MGCHLICANKMEKVAVIGAGLMGHGIAQVFAAKGKSVCLVDLDQARSDQALGNIRANLELLAEHSLVDPVAPEQALCKITTNTAIEAAADADFVIECVAENLEIKQEVFWQLDNICTKDAILATNTSVMSIGQIASRCSCRERVLGTHFWNPPYLLPLVEVIKTKDTADTVVEQSLNLLREVGKKPVLVKKDVPGFVANRLQHALWREAISIVERGIADPETVDTCIKESFGLRLPVLAPLENADLVGLDLTFAIHDYILKHLENSAEPSSFLKAKLEAGQLGMKSGQGFMQWPADKAEASKKKLQLYLIKALKEKALREGN